MDDRHVHKVGNDHYVVSDSPVPPLRVGSSDPNTGGLEDVVESVWAVAIGSLVGFWLIRMFIESNSSWRCPSALFWGVVTGPATVIALYQVVRFRNLGGKFPALLSAAALMAAFMAWGL